MPSLRELQDFKFSFGDIGNEKADLAKRNLHYDDLEIPENEPTPLPDPTPPDTGGDDAGGADTAPDGAPDLDFGDLGLPPLGDDVPPLPDVPPMDDFGLPDGLLDGLSDDLSSPPDFPPDEPASETPAAEPEAPAADFNMDDLLGNMPADMEPQPSEPAPTVDDFADMDNLLGNMPDEPAAEEPTPEAPAEDFSIPDLGDIPGMEGMDTPVADEPAPEAPEADFNMDDLGLGDIPGMDTPADEPAPEAPAEPQPSPEGEGSPLDDFSMPDLGDMGLGDIPGLDTPPATEEPAPDAPADDFSMPDLGDMGLGEPQPSPQGEGSPLDIPGLDTPPAAEEPAPEAPAEDDFSMPDLGDMGLGDIPGMEGMDTPPAEEPAPAEPQPSEPASEGSPLETPAAPASTDTFDVNSEIIDLNEGMDMGSESLDLGGEAPASEMPADDVAAEEAEPVLPEEGEPQPSPEGDGSPLDFGSADDFGITDAAGKEKPAKPTAAGASTDTTDDFALPDMDLGDLGGGAEPQPSEFTSEGSPLDAGGDATAPDFGADLGGTDATDDFSLPDDLSGIDLGGESAEAAADADADLAAPSADFGADDFGIPDIPDAGAATADMAAPTDADFSIPDIPDIPDTGAAPADDLGSDLGAGAGAEAEEPPASPVDFGGGADDFGIPDTGAGGEATPPPDNFDNFNLDEDTPLVSDGSSEGSPAADSGGGAFDLGDDPFASGMDFHLPGIDDPIPGAKGPAKPAAKKPGGAVPGAEEDKVEEIMLTEEDLDKFVKTLTSYPLNLRIASEEVIAEQVIAPDLMSRMVKLLVNGASAKEAAALAGKILSRKIEIPKGYEKSSGEALEREKGSLAYIFVHSFLPILRLFAMIALMVGCVSYLVYQFIYKPVSAERLYKLGYERIGAGEYQRANERFTEAFNRHRKKSWFYKYAEGFRDERQYIYAEQKYDELLYYYPRDKKGVLDYAYMETNYIRDYEKADRLLRNYLLDYAPYDMEGLIAQGDNALAWGEVDPAKYEDARFAYARLLDKYGWKDPIVERMMKYFIRTDNLKEVLPLYDYFNYDPKKKISADTLAELGGYLLDKTLEESRGVPNEYVEQISGIRDLLLRAVKADPSLPESHYHLARYYGNLGNEHEERITLENAITNFDSAREESIRRLKYRIDAQRRYGNNLIRSTEFFTAEESLVKGINLYEDSVARRLIQRNPDFGKMYASLGDLEYFTKRGDWRKALDYYHRSEQNGWCPPEIQYRMGSSYYLLEDWQNALQYLFNASSELPLNRRLLFALGNASYQRGDNFAAQAYYTRLMEVLDSERARLPLLLPNDRNDYLELAERIMMAMNNAGVVNELLARQTGNAQYRSRALGLYAESSRAWDSLTRNPETMIRSGSKPIPLLNSQNLLYPQISSYQPQIFVRIDRDVLEPSEWEALLNRVRPTEIFFQEDTALVESF